MVEAGDFGEAPEAAAEAALDRHGPQDAKPDLETAYHWAVYARRREQERQNAIVALRTRMRASQ